MEKTQENVGLTADMMEQMLDEIAQYSLDLEEDPTQIHLGIPYLQKILAKCRQYTNRVQYYMQRVKRCENRLRSEIKILELDLDFKVKEKLADDQLVRKQSSIEDRRALAITMLSVEYHQLAEKQVALQEVEECYKIIKGKHMELQRTSNDIKTQRNLVKDDMLARLGGHEGYLKPQVSQDKSVPEGLPPPVERRPDPTDLLAGVRSPSPVFEPPPLEDSLKELMADFLQGQKSEQEGKSAADALVGAIKDGTFAPGLNEVFAGVRTDKTDRDHVPQALGTNCSVCGQPQFTSPGGETCPNGHGGAPAAEPAGPVAAKEPGFDAPVATGMSYEDLLS